MTKPRILVSIKSSSKTEDRDGNPALLRDIVLDARTSVILEGWSKANLLRSVAHRRNQTFSLSVLEIEGTQKQDLYVHLGTREKLTLSEVLVEDAKRKPPLSIFVLYCKPDLSSELRDFLDGCQSAASLFIIVVGDSHYFFFALACELTHWWLIESCRGEVVTYEHLADCVVKIARAYLDTPDAGGCTATFVLKAGISAGPAWNGGENYAKTVDIEKFRAEARDEQLDDTLKRMSDAANHPRGQHSAPEERMVSAQGLFWLSEASGSEQMSAWLSDTRLYRECHPYQAASAPPILLRRSPSPDTSMFESLDAHFIRIPGAVYHFGSDANSVDSEPPAARLDAFLSEFLILRRVLTYGFLKTFMQCDVPDTADDLPVVGLSYFEADFVAQVCNSLYQEHPSMQGRRGTIKLPTEYQWEAAARGSEGRNYPWGSAFEEGLANYGMNIGHSTPVGRFSPGGDSIFGCEDMAGNVREWTRSYGGTQGVDWKMHDQRRVRGDENKIVETSRMIVKGGSYSYSSDCLQNWVRNTQIASRRDKQTGFRFVLEV